MLRNPSQLWMFGAAGVCSAAALVTALVLSDALWPVLLILCTGGMLFLALRPRVILTPKEVVLINVFRRRIKWEDIVSVETAVWVNPKGPNSLAMVIRTKKRRRPLRSWAVTSNTRGVGVNTTWVEETAAMIERERRQRMGSVV